MRISKNQRLLLLGFLVLVGFLTGCATLASDILGEVPLDPWEETVLTAETEGWTYQGQLTVEMKNWNWLFLKSPEKRLEALENQARDLAKKTYGPGAEIRTRSLSSGWHPFSLFMLFDLLGFVEENRLTVQVWVKNQPLPGPAEPQSQARPRYRVVPRENYTTDDEFINVKYKSFLELLDELELKADEEGMSAADLDKQKTRLPAGGIIFITLGRKEAHNAISRWFLFTLEEDGKRHFRRRGIEDIPYIPGGDKLWWNDLEFEVKNTWESPLDLTIQDDFLKKNYYFQIIRDENVY